MSTTILNPDDYPEPHVLERAKAIFERSNSDPHLEFEMTADLALPPGQERTAGIGIFGRQHYVQKARQELAAEGSTTF